MKDEKQPKKKSNKKVIGTAAALISATAGAVATILGVVLPHVSKSEDNIIHHIHHNAPVVAPKPDAVATPHIVSHNPYVPGDLLLIAINAIQNPGRKARAMQIFKHMTNKDIS